MSTILSSREDGFSVNTLAWLESADLKRRQELGQFMTPRFLRSQLLERLDIPPGSRILDPAAGTGEFLRDALDMFPGVTAVGWDVDPEILRVAAELVPEAELVNRSGLDDYTGDLFDFVIGNPPYFEFRIDEGLKSRFSKVISGRANIYAMFFQVGINALKHGGVLAYVVPPSMNAGAYFKSLRQYLTVENHILSLEVFSDSSLFADAQTSVQIVVVRKGQGESNHVFYIESDSQRSRQVLLCEDPSVMQSVYEGSTSLNSLGYEAVTGSTVWNQHKEALTNEPGEDTLPLLYARNIVEGSVCLAPDDRRPQYIRNGRELVGPAIVVNRIIGGVGKGQVRAGLIPEGYRFAAENHLNVIRPRKGADQLVDFEELRDMIMDPELVGRVRLLTGNTQLSATEWNHLVPLKSSRVPIQTWKQGVLTQ